MAGTAGEVLAFLEAIRRGDAPILRVETVAAMIRDQVGAQAQPRGPGWGFGYGWAVLADPVWADKVRQGRFSELRGYDAAILERPWY